MTEEEARAALRRFVAVGGIEPWIAEQPWRAVPTGWTVEGGLHGRRFRLEPVPGRGLRVVMSVRGGEPADWIVPARSSGARHVGALNGPPSTTTSAACPSAMPPSAPTSTHSPASASRRATSGGRPSTQTQ